MKHRRRLRPVADDKQLREEAAASFPDLIATLHAITRLARTRTEAINRALGEADALEAEDDWDEWM